jgi:hypothetical protein
MENMFQQSFAIDNFQKPVEKQNATIKLMDHSKDTEDFPVENVEHRIKNAKKLGITDLDSQYLNPNDTVNFEKDIGLADKIEIMEKRKKLKNLIQDSRLDDSRKYAIGKPTPAFGDKVDNGSAEGSEIINRVDVSKTDLKYDLSLEQVRPEQEIEIELAVEKFLDK